MGTSRLEAFSDGVLAIAITLLILEVRVPDAGPNDLGRQLAHIWPSYFSYVISFAIIGIIWVNHHALFEQVARADRLVLFLNLLLLLTVAWLPFPTALLARYVRDGDNAHLAAALYGASMAIIGVAFMGLWWYLGGTRAEAVRNPAFTATAAKRALRRTVVGPVAYTASVGLAFVSPVACLFVWAALAIYFVLPAPA